MPEKLQLGAVLVKRVGEFREELKDSAADIQDMGNELMELVEWARGVYSERSERWQESDKGTNASSWIDALEELADRLQTLGGDAAELADDLVDIPEEPEPTY